MKTIDDLIYYMLRRNWTPRPKIRELAIENLAEVAEMIKAWPATAQ